MGPFQLMAFRDVVHGYTSSILVVIKRITLMTGGAA
jgi:hypothetical protein